MKCVFKKKILVSLKKIKATNFVFSLLTNSNLSIIYHNGDYVSVYNQNYVATNFEIPLVI